MKMKLWDHCTKREKIRRWEEVVRVLRNLSPHERRKHFDMSWWGTPTECGTVACAAGHCGLDPWFRRRGFQLNFPKRVDDTGNPFTSMDISHSPSFFGYPGTREIFYNSTKRSVGSVIRECLSYIEELKAENA